MPITNADFSLLRALNANNNRPWMQENKAAFVAMDTQFKKTYAAIFEGFCFQENGIGPLNRKGEGSGGEDSGYERAHKDTR